MLDVKDLRVQFDTVHGAVHAVNDVSFHVGSGETVGIVGESGCGKSVTIRAILGLVSQPGRVSGGQVTFDGKNLVGMKRRRLRKIRGHGIGFVAQNPFGILNPVMRIEKQFYNVVKAHKPDSKRSEVKKLSLQLLEAVGIVDSARVLNGYAHELSGGMAQRVGIAMSMLLNPSLIIADEPTTALDVTVQRQILDLIRNLVVSDPDNAKSMLLVTHDLGVVAQYCDRVVVLYAGKVVETGPVEEVFNNPTHPYTLALLQAVPQAGKPLVNLKGRLPNLIDYPKGCPFVARCKFARDICAEEMPALLPVEGHDTRRACWADVEEVSSRGAA